MRNVVVLGEQNRGRFNGSLTKPALSLTVVHFFEGVVPGCTVIIVQFENQMGFLCFGKRLQELPQSLENFRDVRFGARRVWFVFGEDAHGVGVSGSQVHLSAQRRYQIAVRIFEHTPFRPASSSVYGSTAGGGGV